MITRLFILASLFLNNFLAAQSHGVFVQNIPLTDGQPLQIRLDAPFQVKTWDGNTIRIEATVTLFNCGRKTLDHLLGQGQYLFRVRKGKSGLFLAENKARGHARLNGRPIGEAVSYTLYLPKTFQFSKPKPRAVELAVNNHN